MKTNTFEGANEIMHDDFTFDSVNNSAIKGRSTLREAFSDAGVDSIEHTDFTGGGIINATGNQVYGFNDPEMLFPDAKMVGEIQWIQRRTEWVSEVINGTHHTPFSRIKSIFANITEDEARAKGYIKGNMKKEEVFTLLKRTTTPQTIYKKQKLDKDDIDDITDLDVVAWIKGEMRMMLEEELARAILVGDGRLSSSDDKIKEDCIRPIWSDADLFTIKAEVTGSNDEDIAREFIKQAVRSRKDYKGTGTPVLFTTEALLTEMLLLEDKMGRKLYDTQDKLATAMRVSKIVTVEAAEDTAEFGGIIVNLSDYNVGADKGGNTSLFDDFDIDYNQYKYLIETRCSGALIKPFSAIAIHVKKADAKAEG